jgi:hypothetical protein
MDISPLRRLLQGSVTLTAILLTACGGGGGGGGGGSTPTMPAPSGLQYSAPPAFTIQQAIAPLTPTVTGQITSYSVNPALPAGLALSSSTGVISGTPTAIATAAAYTVTAANATGSTTASVSITVNDVPPTFAYPSPSYGFTANTLAQTIIPITGGGAVTAWSVNPALPSGLTLDTENGKISGTPTAAAASATYMVTAANSGGPTTASLTLAVAAAPLLDLGHANEVILVRASSADVLSLDEVGHWILQAYSSGTTLASGDGACGTGPCEYNAGSLPTYVPVDLAGSVMIDTAPGGVEVRSATDGHILATLPASFSWYRLASDGSYICAGSTTSLTAWNSSGQTLVTEAGDYSKANVFAAPGQILVALGAAGQSIVEAISLASGTSTQSPNFQGTFDTWFLDGGRFLTSQGNVVWTYSSAGVLQDTTQLASPLNLAGEGNWLWTSNGIVKIYQVGSSTAPAFTSSSAGLAIPSGTSIGLLQSGSGQLSTIDLSGTTPISTSYSVPIASLTAYASIPGGSWITGNAHGVLLDGATVSASAPRYLTLGAAWSIAGGTSYFSVATASGKISSFDATTNALVSTLNFSSSQLAASSSGTVLAAAADAADFQYESDRTLNVYSLPSGNVLNSFTYVFSLGYYPSPGSVVMSLSGDGSVLEAPLSNTSGCTVEVITVTSGAPLWCGTATSYGNVQLSPDGTMIAAALNLPSPNEEVATTTDLYKNGAIAGAIAGSVVGWLDNTRLLANNFQLLLGDYSYDGVTIYDSLGNVQSTFAFPQTYLVAPIMSTTFYSTNLNVIVSSTKGATTWASGNSSQGVGAVAGSQIIFASGASVLAQPY